MGTVETYVLTSQIAENLPESQFCKCRQIVVLRNERISQAVKS
jgi:hypothetical protein